MGCKGGRSALLGFGPVAAGPLLGAIAHANDVMALRYGRPNPTCVPVSVHKLSDIWTANDRAVKLVQGIQ
jgi:hypothetical protein